MDAPPSRRRCREAAPSTERNVRRRCTIPDLVASRRRRREEAAAATLAARVGAACGRNVRPRLPMRPVPFPAMAVVVSTSTSIPVGPRRCVVASEFSSKLCHFLSYVPAYV